MSKIGRNQRCPCGSGRKYKRCHGDVAARERVERAVSAADIRRKRHEANELRRKAQQGLGKPIISAELGDLRLVASGNRLYYGKAWNTFPDFLMYFLGSTLGAVLGKDELAKDESVMHPVALWHRRVCALQAAHLVKRGEVFDAPETGAARAYLDLAYNLYLLEHNAELRKVLISRLAIPDQFLGAQSEIRVAGMFIRAGFSVKFHDESDSLRTHCEYDVTRLSTGKTFSVEVKTRHWNTFPANDDAGRRAVYQNVKRLLRLALRKEADFERIVVIELAMPDEAPEGVRDPVEPWWLQPSLEAIRDTERSLQRQGKPIPAARVIVCNHPYHLHLDSTRSIVGLGCDGIGPNNFRSATRSSIREAVRHRKEHENFLALWNSVQTHKNIPQTFDATSQHLAHGDHPPRLLVGNRYPIPTADGTQVIATLEQAVGMPSEKEVYGIFRTDTGERVICTNPMIDAELKAYMEHPTTFFGVVQKEGSLKDPVDMYLWFFETYGKSSKEDLLRFMAGRSDIETLRTLSREELAEIYCEGLAYGVMARSAPRE